MKDEQEHFKNWAWVRMGGEKSPAEGMEYRHGWRAEWVCRKRAGDATGESQRTLIPMVRSLVFIF